MRLDGHRARQSLVGLSAHCANSYIPHVQHIIQYTCAAGCRNLKKKHFITIMNMYSAAGHKTILVNSSTVSCELVMPHSFQSIHAQN